MNPARLRCPSPRTLSRSLSETSGGGAARRIRIRDHVRSCEACRAEWASFARLAELSNMLKRTEAPPPEDLEAVRTSLLAASGPAPHRPALRAIWVWLPAVGLAMIASLWFGHQRRAREDRTVGGQAPMGSPLAARVRKGTVHAGSAAMFSLMQDQPDEIVRLREGEVTVEVEPLSGRERFRVMTGDAAVEVRGTVFSAVAANDRLVKVVVRRGRVVVQLAGKAPATLEAGEGWERPNAPPQPGPSAGPSQRPPGRTKAQLPGSTEREDRSAARRERSIERRVALLGSRRLAKGTGMSVPFDAASPAASAAERAFAEGWMALRAQRLEDGAAAFARALDAAPDDPLSEDAWFWMAVCQARIPRPDAARASLAAFIERFPRSARAGEAAAMLGWLLVDDGDLDQAARWFTSAARDSSAEVRRSADDGLRTVQRRRGIPAPAGP